MPSNIKIGFEIDKNSARVTSQTMKRFYADLGVDARKHARVQGQIAADAAKEQARTQTTLTREIEKQNAIRAGFVKRAAEQETRARQTAINQQKRDMDALARYQHLSGEKSTSEYIARLNKEIAAETQSNQRRLRLLQERQRAEAKDRPSVTGAIGRGAVAGVSALGSAAVIRETLGMANRLADLASDLVEARDKNKRIFGEAAKDVDDWAAHADKTLGLSRTKALEAATTIGNLLHAGGINGRAGADLSTKLVQRGADIGSLNNQDPEVIADKIKSGLAGQVRPLREVGIFLSANRVKAEAFADGLARPVKDAPKIARAHQTVEIAAAKLALAQQKYGQNSIEAAQANVTLESAEARLTKALAGNKQELTEAVKIQARANIIFKDTELTVGNFAATSKEAANAQRIFNAELENAEVALGQKFLPLKKQVLSFLNDMLDKFNSLSDSTKNFAVTTAAIGGVAIPLAAGVTNIVVQLLRIKSAYDAIKAAQSAAALSAGLPTAAKIGARFAGPLIGAAESAGLAGLVPFAAPVAVAGGLAYLAGREGIGNSERNIANTELSTRDRIAFLRSQNATIQGRIDKQSAGRSGGSGYASAIQGDDPYTTSQKQEQAKNNREIKLLENQLARETKDGAARQLKAKKAENAAKDKADAATRAALNAGNPGFGFGFGNMLGGGLYSGAARNAAAGKADAEAKKQERAAKKLDSDSDKLASNFFLWVNSQAAKQQADVARFLKETQDLWDKGSAAIAEANYTEAKNALEMSDDPKRIKDLAKTVRDHIMEMYNAELSHLDAQFDRDIKPQAGESPARRAAREGTVNARRNEGYTEANLKRNQELDKLDKQVQSAEEKADAKRVQQAEKAIRSRDEFLAAEHRIIERQIKDADRTHDFEREKTLINQRMLNEQDTARRIFFLGFKTGDISKIAEGNEKFRDAQDAATDALRDLAQRINDQPILGPPSPITARYSQSDANAKGRDRFFVGADGLTYDRRHEVERIDPKSGTKYRDLRKVDGAAIDALAGMTDAAKERGGDFFKALINGESGKNALRDLGRNLGKDFGERAGDFLQRKLIDGPMDKLFDSYADKLEGALSAGGKEAGGNIAGAALLLSSAANLFGKNGKKKQRNTFLGGALGLGLASVLPGVGNLAGLGIGAALGGAFADGGYPPIGKAVLVGERGPELAMFGERTRIVPAEQTAQIMRGGGVGGSTTDARQINMKIDVNQINDRADGDRLFGQFTDALSSWDAFH